MLDRDFVILHSNQNWIFCGTAATKLGKLPVGILHRWTRSGFLLVYRVGWNVGIAAVLVNVVASLLLVPVALIVFKQQLTWINIIGILVCLAGLVMLDWKQ